MSQQYQSGVERRREGNRGLLIVLLAIITIVFTVFGCGAFLAVRWLLPVNTPVAELQTPEEKQAELQTAFSTTDVGLPPDELRELQRLFDRLTEAAGADDFPGFMALVHLERLHEEMHRSGQMPAQIRLFDILIQESLADQLWLPIYATRYHIVHVTRQTDPDEAVVYVHFWDSLEDATEMRVWVTRARGDWEVFDWELLQFGMRASHELALYQSPDVDAYSEFFTQLTRSERFFERNEYDKGAERLHQCESLLPDISDPLREQARIHLLTYWMAYGYYAEADELARTAVSPTAQPGAIYAQIVYHNLQGTHELVLDLCDRYEDAIGPGPNVAWYRAEALFGLQRDVDANAARAQYLSWDPDNVDILGQYALDLHPSDKEQFSDYLTQSSDPLDASRTLAERFSWYGDQAALNIILSYLETNDPTSAEMEYVNGLRLELQGDDDQASERFLAALRQESDEFTRNEYYWKYMACMDRLGQVLRAYENAPDPDEAFAYLANGDTDEGGDSPLSPAVLRELVDIHRIKRPNDPWWAYHLGNLSCLDGEFEEALHYYELGLTNLKNDEYGEIEWALETRIQDCLVASGRWRDAYQRGESPADMFDVLASELYWGEQFDILRDLVELHRRAHPQDPMGCYYAGRLALRDREFDDAEALLNDAWTLLDSEDYRHYQIRMARVELHIARGNALDAYGNVPPDEETFSQLAAHFTTVRDFDSLSDLIELRRQDAADDVEPVYQQIVAQFAQQDYAAVLDTIDDVDPGLLESLEYYSQTDWDFRHLRSLLRTEQFPAAIELAREVSQREADSRALIVALCCAGDYDEARELLEDYDDYSYTSIYNDPDAGGILRGDAFLAARANSPPNLPGIHTTPLVALLDRPLTISSAGLQPVVSRILGPDARVSELSGTNEENVDTFVVTADEPELLIMCGSGLYQEDLSQMRTGLSGETGRWEAVVGHRAWCVFALIQGNEDVSPDAQRLSDLRRLAGELFAEEWLAVWDGAVNRIFIPSDGLPELLLDETSQVLNAGGESLWLYRSSGDLDREWILQERVRRLLHGAARQWMASDGTASLEIVAEIHASPISELARIQVASIRRAPYSGWTLSGHLISDSQLVPWLHSGDPIRLDSASVIDWTLTTGTATLNARIEARQWWERTRGAAEPAQLSE